MSWKDRFEKNLRNLDKDPVNERLIIGDFTFLLKEDTHIDAVTIRQLAELDDPLIQALCSFLIWKLNPHENFPEIRDFFSNLNRAMTKYTAYEDLTTKLLEVFVNSKTQFGGVFIDELEDDLLRLESYLDKTLDYEFYIQLRILKMFANALNVLASKNKINKTFSIGLKIYKICLELEKKYRLAQKYDLERTFIRLRIEINKILKKDDDKSMILRIAESYEDEGDFYEEKGLGFGLLSYAEAFMSYLDLGKKNRLEKVKRKLKDSGKATISSMKPLPIGSYRIDINEWLQSIIPRISYDNVLKSLTSLSLLYPKIYFPSDEEMGVGMKIAARPVLDDYANVSAILEWNEDNEESKEECRKYRSFQILQMTEPIHSFIRLELFRYLQDIPLLSKEDIDKLIDSSPIESNLKERLKYGVIRHFEGDFVSSSYVLTLQIEPLIRSLVQNKTNLIPIIHKKNRRGATQETTLGTLLDNEEVRKLFIQDFYNLLQLYFTYDLGLNYRNELAHGLINHDKLSEEYSLTVILFICRILFMLKE